jgi:hypothetical protein
MGDETLINRKPPKTLAQMAAEAAGNAQPMQIAGKPADQCPHCGAGMFVDGVNRTQHEIVRYVVCRNKRCGKRFLSKQPPAKLLREVGPDDDSAHGKPSLTLVRDSA